MRIGLSILLAALSWSGYALDDFDRQQIINRIQPVGSVHIQQEGNTPSTQTQEAKDPVAEKKEPGQATYEQYCVTCHRDGVAGAPKFRTDEWKPRLATQKDINGLTVSAIKGLNAMPPKGTCMDCTEDDIKNAIQYMLPKS